MKLNDFVIMAGEVRWVPLPEGLTQEALDTALNIIPQAHRQRLERLAGMRLRDWWQVNDLPAVSGQGTVKPTREAVRRSVLRLTRALQYLQAVGAGELRPLIPHQRQALRCPQCGTELRLEVRAAIGGIDEEVSE